MGCTGDSGGPVDQGDVRGLIDDYCDLRSSCSCQYEDLIFCTSEGDSIIYVGNPTSKINLVLALTFTKQKLHTYDVTAETVEAARGNVGKELMKRYFLVDKAKDAERIGILVGTLGVSR